MVQGLFTLPQGNQGSSLLFSGLPQLQRPLVPLSSLPGGPGGGYPPQLGGRYRQSAPFLWGRPRFPSSRRLQIPGRASRLPLGIAAPVLHPLGFPVAALPLGTRGRSLPLPSLISPIPGGPLVLPGEYSPRRSGNLSPLRVRAVRAPSSGSLSCDRFRSRTLRFSDRSLLWLQLPCHHRPLSHLPVGAPSSDSGPRSRAPPRQWPSLSVGLPPVSLLGGSPVPSPGRR